MPDLKQFDQELKKKNLIGYWQALGEEVYREPPSFEPHLWKWSDVEDAINKAGRLVDLHSYARRVLEFCHPNLTGSTSHTLSLNLQMLKPGEHALAHRHMAGAIRFVIKGRGAHVVVEGESFEIGEGDFVTTPNWTWHDHINDSDQTLLWLDGLDSPLVSLLQVDFHEPHKEGKQAISKSEGSARHELSFARPNWVRTNSIQPPAYCYRWEDTERVLKTVGENPGDPCDGILLDYVNPLTGGPTLPTMSCQIQMLRGRERTRSHRHTSSAIYHVFSGAGVTYVDDIQLKWKKGDSFVVPLWRFHHHENSSDKEAVLFVMNDKPLMDTLGFYRMQTKEE